MRRPETLYGFPLRMTKISTKVLLYVLNQNIREQVEELESEFKI